MEARLRRGRAHEHDDQRCDYRPRADSAYGTPTSHLAPPVISAWFPFRPSRSEQTIPDDPRATDRLFDATGAGPIADVNCSAFRVMRRPRAGSSSSVNLRATTSRASTPVMTPLLVSRCQARRTASRPDCVGPAGPSDSCSQDATGCITSPKRATRLMTRRSQPTSQSSGPIAGTPHGPADGLVDLVIRERGRDGFGDGGPGDSSRHGVSGLDELRAVR